MKGLKPKKAENGEVLNILKPKTINAKFMLWISILPRIIND